MNTTQDNETALASQNCETSPLPWHLSHEYCDGFNIAREIAPNCGKLSVIANVQYSNVKYQPTRDEAKSNAMLIVASVNHADKLAATLQWIRKYPDVLQDRVFTNSIDEVIREYQNAKGGES